MLRLSMAMHSPAPDYFLISQESRKLDKLFRLPYKFEVG